MGKKNISTDAAALTALLNTIKAQRVITVAASDSVKKDGADYVCTGTNDHVTINTAISNLPAGGGEVLLLKGTYSIGQTGSTIGGVTIDKSHVTLRGENAGTKLILVDGLTDVAVVYVNGDGKENIVVKDFYINGNAATQTSTGFICNGVLVRGNVANNFPKNVVVSGMVIENCRRMGVMMFADGGKVLDCHFSGNFGSHVVEALGRNCIIDRCSLLIANGIIADYGFAIDSCDNFIISNNLIRIEAGGVISNKVLNDWPGDFPGIICNNVVVNNGTVNYYLHQRGNKTIAINNVFTGSGTHGAYGTLMEGNNSILANNILKGRAYIKSTDTSIDSPLLVYDNLMNSANTFAHGTNAVFKNNKGYIHPGEVRSAAGSLVAGNANAIAFAWHNPELQDIYIKRVIIAITTAGGTAGALLSVGIADNATGTNRGAEFFSDLNLNATAVTKSDDGVQTTWVFCEDNARVIDGWIVGQILTENAASLAGSYYIEYVGK